MEQQKSSYTQQQHSQTQSSQSDNPPQDKELVTSLPQGSYTRRQKGFNGSVYLSKFVEQRSHLLLPLLGYGLLLLAFFDYTYIFIPPQFTNPVWEIQTIGTLVEHTIAPLLGLMLVFYRREGYIGNLEKKLLGILSWVALLVGLLYLLMFPLGIIDTWRISNYNNAQIAAEISQRSQPLQQIKDQLNQAKTAEQIQKLLASLTPEGPPPKIDSPQKLKAQLLTQISQSEQKMQAGADTMRKKQQLTLLKNCVKWSLGALVSGTLFIGIWHLTNWVRISHK